MRLHWRSYGVEQPTGQIFSNAREVFVKIRLLIGLLLGSAAWAGTTCADWTQVGLSSRLQTYYADSDTIHREGDLARMWTLVDHQTEQRMHGIVFLSGKAEYQYDCAERSRRLLGFELYSGRMGKGPVVYTDEDPSAWEPIAPDSVAENLWKVACQ